ncbi:MAG: tetratricopeptide repeat protein [Planctomycetota bacterium]|jgi:TolA-binding protein
MAEPVDTTESPGDSSVTQDADTTEDFDEAYDDLATVPRQPDRGWRDRWQIPVMLAGGALLVGGLLTVRNSAPENDYEGALGSVSTLIESRQYGEAIEFLNTTMLPNLQNEDIQPRHVREFYSLRGDAIYLAQEEERIALEENFQSVVTDYYLAEESLAELTPAQNTRLALSLAALGREEEAVARADALPDSAALSRQLVYKALIERNLATREPDVDWTMRLLSSFASEDDLDEADQFWAIARQAELQLNAGFPEESLTHLLRGVQRLRIEEHSSLAGELFLLIARSYTELGRFADSETQAVRALDLLDASSPLRGDAVVLRGVIAHTTGRTEEARDLYGAALADHPNASHAPEASLGLAEVEAYLGNIPNAINAYELLLEQFADPRRDTELIVTRQRASSSMLERQRERILVEDHQSALRFAQLGERVYEGRGGVPGDVLQAVAGSHRLIADGILGEAGVDTDPRNILVLDPVARSEARAHYSSAGEYFLKHTRLVILAEDEFFGDSLWQAGDCYDLAGDREKAIEIFSEFASGRPNDPRQPEAMFRLAQAHQALGAFATASRFYEELIEDHPRTPVAAAAHVQLAQCYLLDPEGSNDEQAEQLLETILGGRMLTPEAIEFRVALYELGRIYIQQGKHKEAIARLREAVERYPDDPETNQIRFTLADAYRRSAVDLEEQAGGGVPPSRVRELDRERRSRLVLAQDLYEDVRQHIEGITARELNELEVTTLRNSYFYRADCAFDLDEFESAIRLYDAAAQRYAQDPASLVAMMQIVQCYLELERFAEARTANERAKRRLAELPDDVLDDPGMPLDRKHWERWLEASARLATATESDAPTE